MRGEQALRNSHLFPVWRIYHHLALCVSAKRCVVRGGWGENIWKHLPGFESYLKH